MKKYLLVLIFISFCFSIFTLSVHAQTAECDDCGYCVGRDAPGNWNACKACLYDGVTTDDPISNETILIKPNSDGLLEQVTKTPGRYYTQLGCISTETESFTDPSAPGGVLNFLLNKLIFPIVGVLSLLSLIYGAFLLMTAQGASEQVARGKSYIVGAIVGVIFTFSAILIVRILAGDFLRIPGFTRAKGLEVKLGSQFVTRANGEISYPIVEVYLDEALVESFEVTEEGIFNTALPNPIPEGSLVKLRFANDECPRCKAEKDPIYANNPNRDFDDKNVFVKEWYINDQKCKVFNYKYGTSDEIHSAPVSMWYGGDLICLETSN